jgi:hypothetical protein
LVERVFKLDETEVFVFRIRREKCLKSMNALKKKDGE